MRKDDIMLNGRLKNLGMWASILTAMAATLTAMAQVKTTIEIVSIGIGGVVTIAGIWSNPKEGIGYLDN